jgi:hypothetical protein
MILACIGGLGAASSALAATSPTVTIKPVGTVTSTTAQVSGTVNANGGPTTLWNFQYSKDPETEGWTASAVSGMVMAAGAEEVSGTLEGLEPNIAYQVRLVATNEEGGEGVSAEPNPKLTTKAIPPTIESESTAPVPASEGDPHPSAASEIRLEGVVNANNEPTECHFQYQAEEEHLHAPTTTLCEPNALAGTFGGQGVALNVGGLEAGKVYYYRVVAKNAAGETQGTESEPIKQFETALPPNTPEQAKATGVKATEATLNGVLNPNPGGPRANQPGSDKFVYRQSPTECQKTIKETVKNPFNHEPEEIERKENEYTAATTAAPGLAEKEPAQGPVTGLQPGATYSFCLLVRNEAGEEAVGPPETFTTLSAAPTITSESASSVTATEAMLNAQIDPNGAETHYYFQYGTTESYGAETPVAKLEGTLTATDTALAAVSGLAPGTTYHYRVVATNEVAGKTETEDGKDETFTTSAATPTTTETCPNEKLRAEQPYGLGLPDCRAYEIVSPLNSEGQDATDSFVETAPRAALSGEAVVYTSAGTFADPAGDSIENQFVSRRGPQGWSTQSVEPPHEPNGSMGNGNSFGANDLTPELTEGIANTSAKLTPEAPALSSTENDEELYVDDFATGSYRYVNGSFKNEANGDLYPVGSSTDLTHVVLGGEQSSEGTLSELVNGDVVPVSVTNEGENMHASAGAMRTGKAGESETSVWRAVSADGSRVYFTSPAFEETVGNTFEPPGQLYVRVHSEQRQSPIASPEANGTGTLTEGSNTITSLAVAAGTTKHNVFEGETEIALIPNLGKFVVGEVISGPPGTIESGTKITEVTEVEGLVILHLSAAITATPFMPRGSVISAGGPAPFVVGQEISGDGIPKETTIAKAEEGKLTLSKQAASSGSGVELRAGGGCTVATDACTVDVSAPQGRLRENPAGIQRALYQGASTGGEGGEGGPEAGGPEKVFFTSNAELTEDAYTGPSGNAPNLYEYDLNTKELTDLTVPTTPAEKAEDPEGAAVQGVVQISEDGSYVYFVANGALAPHATAQTCTGSGPGEGCNLYVSHEGRAPVYIATLAADDRGDWHAGDIEGEGGPELNTAVLAPGGDRLAFLSERSLTGYDNEQAATGECEGKIDGVFRSETGSCQEAYLYEAGSAGAGSLTCASCNPTGARPVGPSGFSVEGFQPHELYRSRNLLEDGALFFDSSDALVPHAKDGRRNVYEYENGHVYAISDVAGGSESFFMDASANGENVFFGTADDLLPQVTSNNVDVYDARVDGGFPVTVAPLACTTAEACRTASPPTPSVFGAGPSETFSGPGNLAPPPPAVVKPKPLTRAQKLAKALKVCKRDKKKAKRVACEKQARAKYVVNTNAKGKKHAGGKKHG